MSKLSEQCQIQGLNGVDVKVGDYMGCCDCGLIHKMYYVLMDEKNQPFHLPKGVTLMLRSYREEGLTSEARATKVFKCTPKEESK